MGDRVSNVETKMGEVTDSVNDLIDAHGEEADDIAWLKTKMADLEDRSRRDNLKIRGIPESVQQSALKDYFLHMLATFLPDSPQSELIIDRIHRLPKPPHLPETIPRDTIVRIHFFHIKVRFMRAARNTSEYPLQYANFSFYDDLSKFTMQQRKNLATITKPLRNHQIPYKWGHPVKLIIMKDSKSYTVRSLEEGLTLLRQWNILEPQEQRHPRENRSHRNANWEDLDPPDDMTT